jgi:hypothetical protein
MSFVKASHHMGKPAVHVGNVAMSIKVLTGGGSIVHAGAPGVDINPLWTPPWKTVHSSLRRVAARDPQHFSQRSEDTLESQLLSCIGGHSLCCDVFGAHSKGEVERAGLSFHGEAGLREWEVAEVSEGTVTLVCRMHQSQLEVSRTFTPAPDGAPVIRVTERLKNLVGADRALGRSQHVTLGEEMLEGGRCRFSSNCDRGMTWPEDNGATSRWAVGAEFAPPHVPRRDGGTDDWETFPRERAVQSDLLTMRVDPSAKLGWMVADRALDADGKNAGNASRSMAFCYVWERKAFPWLMTWEENRARTQAPWSARTVCRGLEFGSYALAMGRRWCVERGKLLEQPTFEWLDAFEEKETRFWISLQSLERAGGDGAGTVSAPRLAPSADGRAMESADGLRVPLH